MAKLRIFLYLHIKIVEKKGLVNMRITATNKIAAKWKSPAFALCRCRCANTGDYGNCRVGGPDKESFLFH